MRRFSEMNVPSTDRKSFDCRQISITEIVNREVEVHDFAAGIKTQHGEDRCLIKVKVDREFVKFFTNCKMIKEALAGLTEDDFPFLATVKGSKVGNNVVYKFT